MQFSKFTRTEIGNQIKFSTPTPLEGVQNIKYYTDNSSGSFSKKEFRWSFNANYWSSWGDLNQSNLSNINIGTNKYLFLEIRYISSGSGEVSLFTMYYDGLSETVRAEIYDPDDKCYAIQDTSVNADTLCGKRCDYYLWLPNHKGLIKQSTVINLVRDLSTLDLKIDLVKATYIPDASLSTDFYWNASNLLEVSTGFGGVTFAYVDGSLAYRDSSITALDVLTSIHTIDISNLETSVGALDVLTQGHTTDISNLNSSFGLYETKINLDSSFSNIYIELVNLDTSFGLYETKLNIDTSFGLYETKINIDTSILSIVLGGLNDVSIVGVTDGSVLTYEASGSYWTYKAAGGGITDISLGGLNDVIIVDPSLNDIIVVGETGDWENQKKLWDLDSSIISPLDVDHDVELSYIELETDGGALLLSNMPVTADVSTEQSYSMQVDGTDVMRIYGMADGSGGTSETAIIMDASYFYLGGPTTNGSWRYFIDPSGNLRFEKREASTWTYKGQFE